jgi:hypothetical protein
LGESPSSDADQGIMDAGDIWRCGCPFADISNRWNVPDLPLLIHLPSARGARSPVLTGIMILQFGRRLASAFGAAKASYDRLRSDVSRTRDIYRNHQIATLFQ